VTITQTRLLQHESKEKTMNESYPDRLRIYSTLKLKKSKSGTLKTVVYCNNEKPFGLN